MYRQCVDDKAVRLIIAISFPVKLENILFCPVIVICPKDMLKRAGVGFKPYSASLRVAFMQ